MSNKLSDELEPLKILWKGGYFEGDCLRPTAESSYGQLSFISTLHATFLRCIKPYIKNDTVSLEIGPGRGAWTKALLPSNEIYVLDALPEEHNGFFEYLGYPKNVKYYQVKDFKYEMLPDNYFNYMFSYGCLCHVSFEGIREYAVNIHPKLKRGSNCFWMVADYEKFRSATSSSLNDLSMWTAMLPGARRYLPLKWLFLYLVKRYIPQSQRLLLVDEDDNSVPGRLYHAGIERTCSMLKEVGYQVVDPDVGTCLRDPIIHFIKA